MAANVVLIIRAFFEVFPVVFQSLCLSRKKFDASVHVREKAARKEAYRYIYVVE
jgi:hypothetical protein